MTRNVPQQRLLIALAAAISFAFLGQMRVQAQQLDTASVIRQVDASVKARMENITGYTVTEHYAVFRSKDEIHPVAEMTVITVYKRDSGKSYTILSQTGSSIIRDLVLSAILENEKRLNQPSVREGTWITSANYEMKLRPGGTQLLDGRDCLVLALIPKRKAAYLIDGSLWVDPKDGSIVQVKGTVSNSLSIFTGATLVMRQYANVGSFPQATHIRAVSNSFMFGEIILTIDYLNYQVQLGPPL